MNATAKQSWKETVLGALRLISAVEVRDEVEVLRWTKTHPGGWTGNIVKEPDISSVLSRFDFDADSMDLAQLMARFHADHTSLVGTATLGKSNLGTGQYVRRAIAEVWLRQRSFNPSEEVVDSIVDDVESFIDAEEVTVEFTAPLFNYRCPDRIEKIVLAPNLQIIQLSDDEVTQLYGGRLDLPINRSSRGFDPSSHAIRGSFLERKIYANTELDGGIGMSNNRMTLDGVILALRTFRGGPVGYDQVYFAPARFTPYLVGNSLRYLDAYVPFGSYEIREQDVDSLVLHSSHFRSDLHGSLRAACSRLATAEVRTSSQEKLFDAVVGMEAILLADINDDKYRGETRYRFGLNLAAVQNNNETKQAHFRIGKKLYDLRSRIAHGADIDLTEIEYGNERVTLTEAANRSCEMLRQMIKRFLPDGSRPPYARHGYWETRYFEH